MKIAEKYKVTFDDSKIKKDGKLRIRRKRVSKNKSNKPTQQRRTSKAFKKDCMRAVELFEKRIQRIHDKYEDCPFLADFERIELDSMGISLPDERKVMTSTQRYTLTEWRMFQIAKILSGRNMTMTIVDAVYKELKRTYKKYKA